jgi:hypothetical protein
MSTRTAPTSTPSTANAAPKTVICGHVDEAHALSALEEKYRNSTAACIGNALATFALAEIAILQKDSDAREEVPMFVGDDDETDRPWQTFDNITSDEPDKKVTSPITVMNDVKMGLLAMFFGVADLANASSLDSISSLRDLADEPYLEARAARLMLSATNSAKHLLAAHPLNRDAGFTKTLRTKFEEALEDKSRVDPGSSDIALVFLEFIKVIAWHAGVRAYEEGRLTLNWDTFKGILASLEASLPEEDGPAVRDTLSLVRDRVYEWKTYSSAEKAKKAPVKKPAVKKSPIKPKTPVAGAKGTATTPVKGVPAKTTPAKATATTPAKATATTPAKATATTPAKATASTPAKATASTPAKTTATAPAKTTPAKATATTPAKTTPAKATSAKTATTAPAKTAAAKTAAAKTATVAPAKTPTKGTPTKGTPKGTPPIENTTEESEHTEDGSEQGESEQGESEHTEDDGGHSGMDTEEEERRAIAEDGADAGVATRASNDGSSMQEEDYEKMLQDLKPSKS